MFLILQYQAVWNRISRIIERRWTQMNADKYGLIKGFEDDMQIQINLVYFLCYSLVLTYLFELMSWT